MAFCIFKLTRKQRKILAIVFCVLNGLQITIGLFITVHALYIYGRYGKNLYSEKPEVTFAFVVSAMFGTHIILHYGLGMKIVDKCYSQGHKKSTKQLLTLWLLVGGNTIINLLILAAMYPKLSQHIVRTLRNSLQKGISEYLIDPEWKYTMDKIQIDLKCCGVDKYSDWYDIPWLNKYTVSETAPLVKELRTSQDHLSVPVTPWSCCRVDFPMQCLHDPFQQRDSVHIWSEQPDVILDSINTIGCLEMLQAPIQTALSLYIAAIVFVFLLQIPIFCISRLLHTACRNAILLCRPYGTAPGWFFGRGDCGYSGGPTLLEIMGEEENPEKGVPYMERANPIPKPPRPLKKAQNEPHSAEAATKKPIPKPPRKFKKDQNEAYSAEQTPMADTARSDTKEQEISVREQASLLMI